MAIARHHAGLRGSVAALTSQVHPVFMLPPVAASVIAATLSGSFDPAVAGLHAVAIFTAVYTAHVKDGYIDFHRRGEDDDHPLTPFGCRVALAGSTVAFGLCILGLWMWTGPGAALLTVPCWIIGFLHAPVLDTNPVTVTLGYPVGVGLAVVGGAYAQITELSPPILGLAGILVITLAGVKIVDDAQDHAYDQSIDKRSVAVALGPIRGRQVGLALQVAGLLATVAVAVVGVFPNGAVLAVFAFAPVIWVAADAEPRRATMLLVRGAYVFLAVLVIALFYRPLTGPPPIDIGVLGPYTYLATEVVFGALAFALCYRAGALRTAIRTIAVLYPLAYLWDWYTLTVGVFAIPLRTGIDVLGIPLEEHVFMVVVPMLVIGVHETLRNLDGD